MPLPGEEVELSEQGGREGGRKGGCPFSTESEELTLTLTHTCESNCCRGKSEGQREQARRERLTWHLPPRREGTGEPKRQQTERGVETRCEKLVVPAGALWRLTPASGYVEAACCQTRLTAIII